MTAKFSMFVALAAAAFAVTVISPADAQAASMTSKAGADAMSVPYGQRAGEENQPATGSTRDANGNRTIVNGMYTDSTYSSTSQNGLTYGVGRSSTGTGTGTSGTAIGNSLNVVVAGRYNTVIINSTQENSGDQTVILNGGLNLD